MTFFFYNESLGELGSAVHQGQGMSHGSKNVYRGTYILPNNEVRIDSGIQTHDLVGYESYLY